MRCDPAGEAWRRGYLSTKWAEASAHKLATVILCFLVLHGFGSRRRFDLFNGKFYQILRHLAHTFPTRKGMECFTIRTSIP